MNLPHGWPFPNMEKPDFFYRLRQRIIIPIVGTLGRTFLEYGNYLELYNHGELQKLIHSRDPKMPLITVSNHYSCIDDPCLFALLRWRDTLNSDVHRWSLTAHDICFTRKFHSWFFSSGKCIPIIRGAGVYQRGMDFALDRLKEGKWLHVFPEGRVNMTHENIRLKWGVGRLIFESPVTPTVIPFYHLGMEQVLPSRSPYIPQLFKKVTVVVGDPIDFTRMVERLKEDGIAPEEARKCIIDVLQKRLRELRIKAEEIHRQRK